MNKTDLTFAVVLGVSVATGMAINVYAFDLSAMQNAVMNDPAVQQQVGKQMMQQAAANPGMAANLAGGAMGSMTAAQKTQIMAQANAIAAKLFTPGEQSSLKAFQATPNGASIMAKLPTLAQQLAPTILQMYAGGAK